MLQANLFRTLQKSGHFTEGYLYDCNIVARFIQLLYTHLNLIKFEDM